MTFPRRYLYFIARVFCYQSGWFYHKNFLTFYAMPREKGFREKTKPRKIHPLGRANYGPIIFMAYFICSVHTNAINRRRRRVNGCVKNDRSNADCLTIFHAVTAHGSVKYVRFTKSNIVAALLYRLLT